MTFNGAPTKQAPPSTTIAIYCTISVDYSVQMVGPGDAWRLREVLDIATTYAGARRRTAPRPATAAGCGATRAIVDSELERRARTQADTALGGAAARLTAASSAAATTIDAILLRRHVSAGSIVRACVSGAGAHDPGSPRWLPVRLPPRARTALDWHAQACHVCARARRAARHTMQGGDDEPCLVMTSARLSHCGSVHDGGASTRRTDRSPDTRLQARPSGRSRCWFRRRSMSRRPKVRQSD